MFGLCSIFNSRNRKATGSRKHHYDDSEIKANFNFRAIVEREEMRLRYGQELERDRFRYEVFGTVAWPPSPLSSKTNALSNDSEKLDKFRVKYITETAPMP